MPIKIRVEEKIDARPKLARRSAAGRGRFREEMEEEKERDIETSLAEIYRDSAGRKIDVNRMKIRRKQGLIFWFFNLLILGLVMIVLGLSAYYYIIYGKGTDATAVSIDVSAPDAVSANEDFTYIINYHNQEFVALKSAGIKVEYPKNFIFSSADPAPAAGDNSWDIGRVNPRAGGEIKIKGKIIDKTGTAEILLVSFLYTPENFSSEFKKDNSFNIIVKDAGFDVDFDYSGAALVNQPQNLAINFKPLADNFLPDFIIRLAYDDNIQLGDAVAGGADSGQALKAEKVKDDKYGLWLISGLQQKEGALDIKYRVKNKIADNQNLKLSFEKSIGGKIYVFLEKDLPIQVMKSDLNLNLILNGSKDDQAVDFGQKLNYSLAYSNKGEASMKDVVIMAVLDSDFLDWTTLADVKSGREMGNTITWTKDEIPALANIGVNQQGVIDFSLNVLGFRESDLGKNFQIISYGQYAVGGLDKIGQNSGFSSSSAEALPGETKAGATASSTIDNRSNTIKSVINSDLGFKEQVRYFDENNLPVGNGPLPPQVGEKTSFKVYWYLTNNLHDLNDVKLETVLPAGLNWDEHNRTSVGSISYDSNSKKVTWQIGRLPITVFRADAEFNISVIPAESDRNKIIVLLNGSKVTAVDVKTGAALERNSVPKTSKLEDDEIANMSSDGRVK